MVAPAPGVTGNVRDRLSRLLPSSGAKPPPRSHLNRTVRASAWMYATRALAFGFALVLVNTFGISGYGIYAFAFAAAAMVALPLDSYFLVRAPRVTDALFPRERSTRTLVGLALLLVGCTFWQGSFVLGFALSKAGIDIVFNASRSHLIRHGVPDLAQRADALRQIIGMVGGTVYVFAVEAPSLEVAGLIYLVGCLVPVLPKVRWLLTAKPVGLERSRNTGAILVESVGGVAYVQGDVLLLATLASSSAAGYYSLATMVVWSLAALGQMYGFTFHESLRRTGGRRTAGPPLAVGLVLSTLTSTCMVVGGVAMYLLGADRDFWLIFLLLAPVSFLRTLSSMSSVVLIMQHRDRFRMTVTVVCVTLKLGLIAILGSAHGGPGAAVAFIITDVLMAGAYTWAVFAGPGRVYREPVGS